MLALVLQSWLVLLVAATVLFVLVSGAQVLARAVQAAVRTSAERLRPALEQRPVQQRSTA